MDESARGTGLGKFLVTLCTRLSEKLGVYKVGYCDCNNYYGTINTLFRQPWNAHLTMRSFMKKLDIKMQAKHICNYGSTNFNSKS